MLKFLNFIIPLIFGVVIGIFTLSFFNTPHFLVPFISSPEISATKVESSKPVVAFLPYWNVNEVQIQYHLIDYLAYFALNFNPDGTIQKSSNHSPEMGWLYLNQEKLENIFTKTDKSDVKKMIVFSAFQNELIDTLLSDEKAQIQAINSIIQIVSDYQFQAVNLDFEYNSTKPVTTNSKDYANFIKALRQALPDTEISLCLYANGIIKNSPYQVEELAPVTDHIILMAYDFHQLSSTIAGPMAPINSSVGPNLTNTVNSMIDKKIPFDKVIMAMAFYGYEWRTDSSDFRANTYPDTGAMASYRRVHQLIKDLSLTPQWDDLSKSPYLVYQDNQGFTKQIYYENDQSIGLKLEFINQIGLGGAGIWAIGYEGKNASVWYTIEAWRKGE